MSGLEVPTTEQGTVYGGTIRGEPSSPAPAAGTAIGRYVILEELGRGGMGRVLRAYDPKLRREVALKEIGRDRLGLELTQRLLAEARAMALVSHPNVVAVYDIEDADPSHPLLVMEYVSGGTAKSWLAAAPRRWQEIVAMHCAAGRGLAAAHAAGLLHRDFKPTNVMISNTGAVKVADFGLAKAIPRASESTPSLETTGPGSGAPQDPLDAPDPLARTRPGVAMGTWLYMAPEQHRGEPLTAAADQYAFCVSLWEALHDEAPFRGPGLLANKQEGPGRWTNASVPRRIAEAIRRGLHPDPRARWPDLRALLDVLEANPTRRRRRNLMAGLGLAVVAVGLGWHARMTAASERCKGAAERLTGSWGDPEREQLSAAFDRIGAAFANDVLARTETALDRYASSWAEMYTEACEATSVRGEQTSELLDRRMLCLERARQSLAAAVGVLVDADVDVAQRAHEVVGGLRPLSQCADLEALLLDVPPPLPAEAAAIRAVEGRLAQASAALDAGQYGAAQAAVEEAKRQASALTHGPLQANVALIDGDVRDALGDHEGAVTSFTSALRSAATWTQWREMAIAARSLMLVIGSEQQRFDAGLAYRPLAMGLVHGRPEDEAAATSDFARVLAAQGNHAEAELEQRRVIAALVELSGPDDLRVVQARDDLARTLLAEGEIEAAAAESRRALDVRIDALGPAHPLVAASRDTLAIVLYFQGQRSAAEAEFRDALRLREHALGPNHLLVAESLNNVAVALAGQGKHEEAVVEYRRSLAVKEQLLAADHPDIALSLDNLAAQLALLGQLEEAEAIHRRALGIREQRLGADHPMVAQSEVNLATVLLQLHRAAEARELAARAWALREHASVPAETRAATAFVLARALWDAQDDASARNHARELAAIALVSFGEAGPAGTEHAHQVTAWLAEHPAP